VIDDLVDDFVARLSLVSEIDQLLRDRGTLERIVVLEETRTVDAFGFGPGERNYAVDKRAVDGSDFAGSLPLES